MVAVADGDVRGPLLVPVESTAEATPDVIAIRMLQERWLPSTGTSLSRQGASGTGVLPFRELLAQPLEFPPRPRRGQLPAACVGILHDVAP